MLRLLAAQVDLKPPAFAVTKSLCQGTILSILPSEVVTVNPVAKHFSRQLKIGPEARPHGGIWPLTLGALGVVFGDLGTSPLYALNQIFFSHRAVVLSPENVTGCISLVVWALTTVIALKYLVFVIKADNDGQGGVFALYALLHRFKAKGIAPLMILLLVAAGLLFGGGMITPAISVLSAIEGLKVAAPSLEPYVVPLTILTLTGLFAIQSKGTAKVGAVFGPIIVCWFAVIAVLGVRQIVHAPAILGALNPVHGVMFLQRAGWRVAFFVLAGVMLSITGGEALYADMGHFGAKPIRRAWSLAVYPALLLNYLGQGAFLLSGQVVRAENLFYSLVPAGLVFPMVILATASAVIASQALISGAFSLSAQAVGLGLFPRLKVVHTHQHHEGQIYVPLINWAIFVGCVLLVFNFKSSASLASAYGLAVAGDMFVTSFAMMFFSRFYWKWRLPVIGIVFGSFLLIDSAFMWAYALKFFEGGYIPVAVGIALFVIMSTWKWGRKATFAGYSDIESMTIRELIHLKQKAEVLIDKNVILMVPKPVRSEDEKAPALLQFFWNRTGLLPKNLIFVEVVHKKVPYVHDERYEVTTLQRDAERGSIMSVAVNFGFMEEPNVEKVLESLAAHREVNLPLNTHQWIVHVSQENLLRAVHMPLFELLRLRLFGLLRQISRPGHYYYGLGNEVQLSVEIMPVRLRKI